jgi:hypothetical protein
MAAAPSPTAPAIDLGVRRDLSGLVEGAIGLWKANVAAFLSLALVVVAPAALVLEIYSQRLTDGMQSIQDQLKATPNGATPTVHIPSGFWTALAVILVVSFIQGPLITAIHARAVVALSRAPSIEVGAAIRDAAPVLLIAFVAEVLAVLLTSLALVALVIPGIYLGIRLLFAAQVAAVDGRLRGALAGSWRIVKGQWWRTFGLYLLFSVMAGVANGLVGALATGLFSSLGLDALGLASRVVVQGVTASLMALAVTLLFFDLRVRAGEVAATPDPAGAVW